MVFKWFKARMIINQMPENSSAVSGIYKQSAVFDFDPLSTNGTENFSRSTLSLTSINLGEEEALYAVSTGPSTHLQQNKLEPIYGSAIDTSTSRLQPTTRKADFKKKKTKAPTSKMLESTNGDKVKNETERKESSTENYYAIKNGRLSDGSEIEI